MGVHGELTINQNLSTGILVLCEHKTHIHECLQHARDRTRTDEDHPYMNMSAICAAVLGGVFLERWGSWLYR